VSSRTARLCRETLSRKTKRKKKKKKKRIGKENKTSQVTANIIYKYDPGYHRISIIFTNVDKVIDKEVS
jgi:regulator of replication initiation timing